MVRLIRAVALTGGVGLFLCVVVAPWLRPAPASADELPTDQPRRVVFELFTPPVDSSGGG